MTDPTKRPPGMADPASPPTSDQTKAKPDESNVPYATIPEVGPRFTAPAYASEVGTFGRYRVLKKIGQGGMGAVFLGYDSVLERKVALKVVLPQYTASASARERFLREARLAAKVKSDHVVTIFDVGEEGGVPFIAMEYLLGLPLNQYLAVKGGLPLVQALRVCRETATGLAAVHELGLVHRDIKPGNIWLESPNGRVKLLDFGLARLAIDDVHLTGTGAVLGTVAYMSPEQGRGQKLDHRSDLFSLGTMLYQLCTGRMPFSGDTTMALLTSLAVDTPVLVRQHDPSLPAELEAVVARLLAKNPDHRFQTALEVAEALQAIEQPMSPPRSGVLPTVVPVQPRPLFVGAQTHNVWEGIADSESVPVPLAISADTEIGPAPPDMPTVKAERKPIRRTPVRKVPKWPLFAAAGLLLAMVAVIAALLLRPLHGTLTIMNADDDVELVIKKNGKVVHDRTREREFVLVTGTYTIELTNAKAGTTLDHDKVEIREGTTSSVLVRSRKQPPVVITPPSTPVLPLPLPLKELYDLPTDLIQAMNPVRPAKVFTLDHLDPTKHVLPEEKFDWQPKELVAVLGSHRQRFSESIRILTVDSDGTSLLVNDRVMEIATRKVLDRTGFTVFSPNGKRAVVGKSIWTLADLKAGPVEYSALPGWIKDFFAEDVALVQGPKELSAWKLDPKEPKPFGATIPADARLIVVSRDRKYLAVLIGETCEVYEFVPQEGLKKKFALPGKVLQLNGFPSLGFSDTGLLVTVSLEQPRTSVWDVSGEKPELRATIPTGDATIVWAMPKGDAIVVGRPTGFQIWSINGEKPQIVYQSLAFGPATASCTCLAITPDGKTVITGHGNGSVRFWGLGEAGVVFERTPLSPQPILNRDLDFSPDGRSAILHHEDGQNRLWSLEDLKPRLLTEFPGSIVRYRTDGGAVATSKDGTLRVYPTVDLFGKPTHELAIGANQEPIDFSPDGKWLAAIAGNALVIWNVSAEPREVGRAPDLHTRRARFTPDGRFLVAVLEKTARVWAMTPKGPILRSNANLKYIAGDLAFSPDGKSIAMCQNNSPIVIYELKDGVLRERQQNPLVGNDALWISFSPDSRALLAGGSSTGLKLLDSTTGKILHEWATSRGVPYLGRFHPDGKHLFVTNADFTTSILRLPSNVDRRAAEYVLTVSGTLWLDDGTTALKAAADLPPHRWLALTSVDLTGSAALDDAGLEMFRGCNNLKSLTLKRTKVSDVAVTGLAAGLPRCKIEWDGGVIQPKP